MVPFMFSRLQLLLSNFTFLPPPRFYNFSRSPSLPPSNCFLIDRYISKAGLDVEKRPITFLGDDWRIDWEIKKCIVLTYSS